LVAVNKAGLEETRKRPGWHDEPLVGDRKGQRSIRLNKQWRAIYTIKCNGQIEFIEVKEGTPHEY
jgi:proteic killer suppression protein